MGGETLARIALAHGRYVGELIAALPTRIEALLDGRVVAAAAPVACGQGRYRVALDLPATILSDGVSVISLRSERSGEVLDRVTVRAGDPDEDDLRAEIALIRDELEMLKHAFRQTSAPKSPEIGD